MKVCVNRDNCIGCGSCQNIEPSVFEMDQEGISTVICKDFSKVNVESINEAVECCPTGAITKED